MQTKFYLICVATQVCVDVSYHSISKKFTVKVGKLCFERTGKLSNVAGQILPFEFIFSELNLKFAINVDFSRDTFLLDVQQRPFENLPLRLFPINLKSQDDNDLKDFTGNIELNEIEILGHESGERRMTWDT